MSPYFSVIIPAHNEEGYIRETLHHLKEQTYQDFEVIVVTNGCTDKTEEIVKNRDVNHFSLSQPNVSRARNYGANKAQGDVLLFLDADTTLAKDALQVMKTEFTEKYSVATTKVVPDKTELKFAIAMGWKNLNLSLGTYKGCSGALLCRREDFDKVYGYDSELAVREHRKLILKLLEHGKYKFINTPVKTSMRRYAEWGVWKASLFWVKQWAKDHSKGLKDSKYEHIR
ncbi:MAG: glycosyltransferase [archaeon]|nr:glycosyltransferase [archaeon]